MTDTIQYAWLIIYLIAFVCLLTYGINCYVLMIFYRLNRSEALRRHDEIKKDFYQKFPP
jgi:hypothetical protein